MKPYPEIVSHYEGAREDARLTTPEGRLEFLRTTRLLERTLPPAPAVVYDVGGGTGPYAAWLASKGYEAHLIDLVPGHIEQAKSLLEGPHPIRSATVGDARALAVASGVADAVLLLGPLYHLTAAEERAACWREAGRIVKPGGPVIAATISRFASLLDGLRRDLLRDPEFEAIVRRDLESGVHLNPAETPGYFTTAYFHTAEEATTEAREAGLKVQGIVGTEGPGWLLPDLEERLDDPARREQLLTLLERVEGEPSLIGMSAHPVIVARREP